MAGEGVARSGLGGDAASATGPISDSNPCARAAHREQCSRGPHETAVACRGVAWRRFWRDLDGSNSRVVSNPRSPPAPICRSRSISILVACLFVLHLPTLVFVFFLCVFVQLMMLGAAPRQTTSNLGHLRKPSIQALIHNLNRHYYSINIDYRKNELEQKMLLNLHKKKSVRAGRGDARIRHKQM